MRRYQEVRLSQFILQLGPGAIVETTAGPRLVPLPHQGLFPQVNPEDFAIDVPHPKAILGDRRVFRLPSNAMVGQPAEQAPLSDQGFPGVETRVEHSDKPLQPGLP